MRAACRTWLGWERRVEEREIWREGGIYAERDGHFRRKLYTTIFDRLSIAHIDHATPECLRVCVYMRRLISGMGVWSV